MISIVKKYKFEYAHKVYNQKESKYNEEQRCTHIHGHSGVIEIFLSGVRLNEVGMIIDFTDLKPIKTFIDNFDHSMIISIADEETLRQFYNTEEGTEDLKTARKMIEGNYFYFDIKRRIVIINSRHISSEVIAKYLYDFIKEEIIEGLKIELDIRNGLCLKKLTFRETDNNKVIVE